MKRLVEKTAITNQDQAIEILEYRLIEDAADIVSWLTVEGIIDLPEIFDKVMEKTREIGGETRKELENVVRSSPYLLADYAFYKALKLKVDQETDGMRQSKLLAVLDYLYGYPSKLPNQDYFKCCYSCSGFKPKNEKIFREARELLKSAEQLRNNNAEIVANNGIEYVANRLVEEYMTDLFPIAIQNKGEPKKPKVDYEEVKVLDEKNGIGAVIIKQKSPELIIDGWYAFGPTFRSTEYIYTIYILARGKMKRILTTVHEISIDGLKREKVVFHLYVPVYDSYRKDEYFVYVGENEKKLFNTYNVYHPAPGNWGD